MQKYYFMPQIESTHFSESGDAKFAKFGLVELKIWISEV
jgi:hypothetical protein